jgi:putative transposase
VVFEDEASLSNTATVSYSWSKRGIQPKICQPQRKKERRTIFGCVCPHTGELVTQVTETGNTVTFFSFLLIVLQAFPGKKVYMVLDDVRFHHASRLQPILERYKHGIELIFLPPYSPDLNPVERVWWLMRKQITHNRWVKSMEQRICEFEDWCKETDATKIKNVCNLNVTIY